MSISTAHYSFSSLLYAGNSVAPDGMKSLVYLVSLTDSANHKISETLPAKRILSWLYEIEEQCENSEHLKAREVAFDGYFSGGFYPQTPCMVVRDWSPIGAMLERGMTPRVLNREPKFRAVATGIWDPIDLEADEIESAVSDDALFWAILKRVSKLARERRMWISIITEPGWDYAHAVNSLPPWLQPEVAQAGRLLWKRTPQG